MNTAIAEIAVRTGTQAVAAKAIRALHVNSGNLYGGVESILVTLARFRELCPSMTPHFGLCYEGRLSRELQEYGVPVHFLGGVRFSRPWTVLQARRQLRELIEREQFDVVICHMPWNLAVFGPAVRASGARLAFWAHSVHDGKNWIERLAQRTPPDLAIANSEFTQSSLENLFSNVRSEVIYPPVALAKQENAEAWRSRIRREFNVSDREVVLVQVSRFEPWKGHALHFDALAKLKNADTPWRCWIVGGPQKPEELEYQRTLVELSTKLGISERVHFLGQRQDVPRLLAGADIFCQPNLSAEPFGLVFVEALWAGLPVVATALGGAKEIIRDSCGLLVEPGNADMLAASLRRLIENAELRRRLGLCGPARAAELCDPAAQLNSTAEFLSKV